MRRERQKIDWNNLSALPCKKVEKGEERERLSRLQQRRVKHKPSKAHATGKRRSFHDKMKAKKQKQRIAENNKKLWAYNDQVRAYWSGQSDQHP